ncbi:hypothetical protein OIF23_30825 (plasmid) [Streptomyces albidoflavus]|uniref:hypothetical protein n=1 Tax=Streptomyces albidoflavus TaxID=1886 RepID=UPI0038736A32|nr:hypothetical protein OIF23_30825 [Streptomyces albidoflavus]
MRGHTHTTTPDEGRGLQPPGHGHPSPALLARAEQGYARFLRQHTTDPEAQNGAGQEHHR